MTSYIIFILLACKWEFTAKKQTYLTSIFSNQITLRCERPKLARGGVAIAAEDGAEQGDAFWPGATVWAWMGTDLRAQQHDSIYWQQDTSWGGHVHTQIYCISNLRGTGHETSNKGKKNSVKPKLCCLKDLFMALCETWHETVLFSSLTAPLHPPHLLHISLFSQGRGCKSCFYQNVRLLNYSVSLSEEHPAVCIYTQPCLLIQSPFQQPPWRVKWRLITTKGEHSQFYNQTGLTLWHCLQSRLTRLQQG